MEPTLQERPRSPKGRNAADSRTPATRSAAGKGRSFLRHPEAADHAADAAELGVEPASPRGSDVPAVAGRRVARQFVVQLQLPRAGRVHLVAVDRPAFTSELSREADFRPCASVVGLLRVAFAAFVRDGQPRTETSYREVAPEHGKPHGTGRDAARRTVQHV